MTLTFSLPFLFLAAAPLGFLLGGAWSGFAIVLVPVSLCGLDWALGVDYRSRSAERALAYRALPYLYIALQLAVTIWATIVVANPRVTLVEAVGLTLSVGLTAGVFGILAAHEMVHSPSAAERTLGLILLASVAYMHFRIAHIHGHHRRAATFEDSASARRGENAYRFLVRSITGQAREAWVFEAARLRRRGRPVFGPTNRMLQYFTVEILIAIAVGVLLGPRSLAFWLAQAALAIVLLELFNYIAHYGLTRRRGADARLEPLGPLHSWNSSRRMNNWSLFNMGRHSDHHRRPMQPYQRLEAEPAAPELPTGYAGAILMALVPPLWRRVMDPRVDFWMSQGRPDA